jgi:hypothetical protein
LHVPFEEIFILTKILAASAFMVFPCQNIRALFDKAAHMSVCPFAGDAERRVVIAMRLGASLPLHFQW